MCLREVNTMAMYLCWLGKTEKKKASFIIIIIIIITNI